MASTSGSHVGGRYHISEKKTAVSFFGIFIILFLQAVLFRNFDAGYRSVIEGFSGAFYALFGGTVFHKLLQEGGLKSELAYAAGVGMMVLISAITLW